MIWQESVLNHPLSSLVVQDLVSEFDRVVDFRFFKAHIEDFLEEEAGSRAG